MSKPHETLTMEDALTVVGQSLQKTLHHIDLWRPDPEAPGGFFDPRNRPALRSPELIGDDGNFLIAVVTVSSDWQQRVGSWPHFVNDGVRVLARLLLRAAEDYGMHRLLLLLLLPENKNVEDELSKEIANTHITRGDFRVIILPHCQKDSSEAFRVEIAEHLKLFSPFPEVAFLKRTTNNDLQAYADGGFLEKHRASPFFEDVKKDVENYLSDGGWRDGQRWPRVMQALERITQPVLKEENQS